jgi:stage V sporulation protein AD
MIYSREVQDVHAGGSGCGCSASVLAGTLIPGMREGRWKNILFAATGALLSPTSTLQGESIPCICSAVSLSAAK